MKKIDFKWLFAILSLMVLPINAQIAHNYEVATWHQFRTSAVTYTFDDNTANQLSIALPIFNQYNFKITLFVISGRITNWSGYLSASNNGHEVASHTVDHYNMSTLTVNDQDLELKKSQITIKSNLKSSDCVTVAYPNCIIGDLNSIQKYYIAGRVCNGAIIPSTPIDFYKISSISTGTASSVQTAIQLNSKVDLAKSSKGWCMFMTHAIDGETGYSPTQSSELATHLAYVNSKSSDFWVATFENVVKYIKERNALSISEVPASSDSYLISVTDNLPDSIYNVPITIKRLLPTAWISGKVYQNNEPISSKITTVGSNKYIEFDVIPDKGDLMLTNNDVTEIVSMGDNNVMIEPNPFKNEILISAVGEFKYSVFGLEGRLTEQGQGISQKTIGYDLIPGIYVLKVKTVSQIFTSKIFKL